MNINLLPDEDDDRTAWELTMDRVYYGQQDAHVAEYYSRQPRDLCEAYFHDLQALCLTMVRTVQTLH